MDVSKEPTKRPTRKQKAYYSGKNKKHTLKTEIVMDSEGRIRSVSKTHKGRVHDFSIRKGEKLLPINSVKLADSAYQDLQKIQSKVILPYKGSNKKPLTNEDKLYNKYLSSMRIKVENKIREIKMFKITSEV